MTGTALSTSWQSGTSPAAGRPIDLDLEHVEQSRSAITRARPTRDAHLLVRYVLRGKAACEFMWGEAQHIGTSAFWIDQAAKNYWTWEHRIGRSLSEEVAACLLGGYGVRADVALAAFRHLRDRGLLAPGPPPGVTALENALSEPLLSDDGARHVRYRFPRQRSARIHGALRRLHSEAPPASPAEMRDWLLGVTGIGPKTASWIVRNVTRTEDMAVIDVHVQRAGLAAGWFSPSWRLPRDYALYESAFLLYAALGSTPPSVLDACIWHILQRLGPPGHRLLPTCGAGEADQRTVVPVSP